MSRQCIGNCVREGRPCCVAALLAVVLAATLNTCSGRAAAADDVALAGTTAAQFAENDRQQAARQRIEKALDSPTVAVFRGFPLSEVLETLSENHGIPIVIDEVALEDEGIATDEPVDLNVRGISLESALDLMLDRIWLTFIIRSEVLLITTAKAEEEALTTKVYPVGDLVRRPESDDLIIDGREPGYDELIELITTTVAPDIWDEVGGPGSVTASPSTESLVISQTRRVHGEVEALLAALRRARENVAAEQAGKPDEEGMVLELFPVIVPTPPAETASNSSDEADRPSVPVPDPRPTAEQLAEMIVKMVAPESWEGRGGEGQIQAVSGSIVVRNTAKVMRQIHELLGAIGALDRPEEDHHHYYRGDGAVECGAGY